MHQFISLSLWALPVILSPLTTSIIMYIEAAGMRRLTHRPNPSCSLFRIVIWKGTRRLNLIYKKASWKEGFFWLFTRYKYNAEYNAHYFWHHPTDENVQCAGVQRAQFSVDSELKNTLSLPRHVSPCLQKSKLM